MFHKPPLPSQIPFPSSNERHDVIARVFYTKEKRLKWLQTKKQLFGEASCHITTIE